MVQTLQTRKLLLIAWSLAGCLSLLTTNLLNCKKTKNSEDSYSEEPSVQYTVSAVYGCVRLLRPKASKVKKRSNMKAVEEVVIVPGDEISRGMINPSATLHENLAIEITIAYLLIHVHGAPTDRKKWAIQGSHDGVAAKLKGNVRVSPNTEYKNHQDTGRHHKFLAEGIPYNPSRAGTQTECRGRKRKQQDRRR